ncbi:filament-like plant protein 3 [Primulina tabacum]|uniref:filament-like plant protein 3 n=1 Tax=Primulina tabacum TaxID=48773 RepID=UPI003F5AD8CE
MDRRSWLWRRKSSEKSPSGETESSGSMSSHSERFSDDQGLANQNMQSHEVTSKTLPGDADRNDSLKTLSEKLSEALLDVRTKEDLVKQHAKVAEEAVTGWERAEKEVSILKKQTEALTQRNSILEERVGHLDGALKECLRQLRQAREDQDQKICDIITNKTHDWDSTKSELENQLADMFSKLEAAEKENSIFKLELVSKTEELELRTCERDLSTHIAESASKQHLECVKKIVKLEAECHRLKAVICKATPGNNHWSGVEEKTLVFENFSCETSGLESIGGETCHPESWSLASVTEEGQFKNERTFERSLIIPSAEIDLMDDFLEMEKIVALPVTQGGNNSNNVINSREDHLKDNLEAMINRTAELEENLEKIEMEKKNLEVALYDCRIQLKTSEDQLKQSEVKLLNLSTELAVADKEKRASQKEIEFMKEKHEHLTNLELEIETMHSTICSLKNEVGKERNFSKELEIELSRMKFDYKSQRSAMVEEFRIVQDKELAAAKSKYAKCQKTIASLDRQLKILATLNEFSIDSEESVQIP